MEGRFLPSIEIDDTSSRGRDRKMAVRPGKIRAKGKVISLDLQSVQTKAIC